jgi:adenylate cyclase class IV
MAKELKIKIDNPEEVEKKLLSIGAEFTDESTHNYTYFQQLEGKVLKITRNNEGIFKTRLERKDGKWKIIENSPITEEKAKTLEKENEVKRKMKNKRRFYRYESIIISINSFPDIGNFLILEAENPKVEFITNKLGINKPKIITASFDNL